MNVVVVGGGAVGSFLGWTLARAGHDVTLLRRHGDAGLRREALSLVEPSGGQGQAADVWTATRPEDAPASPDLVLLAVKMPDLAGAIETAGEWPDANLLAVENGVGADEMLAAGRPGGALIAGSLTAAVERDAGTVHRLSRGGIGLAPVRGEVDATVGSLAGGFAAGGLRAATYRDAAAMRWSKLLVNLLGNATSALLDRDPGEIYADPALFAVERRQLREALDVMRLLHLSPVSLPGADTRLLARGMRLPSRLLQPVLRHAVSGGRGGKSPSLRLHLESGSGPSEVAWLNGAVASTAVRFGRRAPVNAVLAALVEQCSNDPGRRAWLRDRPDRLLAALEETPAS